MDRFLGISKDTESSSEQALVDGKGKTQNFSSDRDDVHIANNLTTCIVEDEVSEEPSSGESWA